MAIQNKGQTYWQSGHNYIAFGETIHENLYIVKMQYESQKYAEVRVLKRIGHFSKDDREMLKLED